MNFVSYFVEEKCIRFKTHDEQYLIFTSKGKFKLAKVKTSIWFDSQGIVAHGSKPFPFVALAVRTKTDEIFTDKTLVNQYALFVLYFNGHRFKELATLEGYFTVDNKHKNLSPFWQLIPVSEYQHFNPVTTAEADYPHLLFKAPLFRGSASSCQLSKAQSTLSLVALKHPGRPGMKHMSRGLSALTGIASNEVLVLAFVNNDLVHWQHRGTVPLVWQEKYKSRHKRSVKIHEAQSPSALALHFKRLDRIDQSLMTDEHLTSTRLVLNLLSVDKAPREAELSTQYKALLKELRPDVQYLSVDFHEMTGLDKDLSTVIDCARHLSYTAHMTLKNPIFRTNCMDSADRTNVASLGLFLGFLDALEVSLSRRDEKQVQTLWNAVGDDLAVQYMGSKMMYSCLLDKPHRFMGLLQVFKRHEQRIQHNESSDIRNQTLAEMLLPVHKVNSTQISAKQVRFFPAKRLNLYNVTVRVLILALVLGTGLFVLRQSKNKKNT